MSDSKCFTAAAAAAALAHWQEKKGSTGKQKSFHFVYFLFCKANSITVFLKSFRTKTKKKVKKVMRNNKKYKKKTTKIENH